MMEWILSSSVLILVVLLIRRLTLGRISMRLRYALWALVLVRLLVPFSFGSTPVSIMNTAQQVPVIQDAQVLHDIGHIEHAPSGAVEGYHQSDYSADFPTVIAQNKSEEEFSRMTTVLNLRDVLIPLWKTGVLVLFATFLLANLQFRRTLRKTRRRLEADLPLPVYVTDSVETPCLLGLIRPTVYVTPEVASDPQALHYALEHELTHFYQGDFVWAVLRCVCLCLHWFNPLVWLAVKLSRQDAELSCDEGTIRRLGESHRVAYGNTLIDLTCTQRRPTEMLYAATTMTGSKKSIRERVTFIARKPRNLALAVVIVALVTAVAVGCTFTGADKPAEEPEAAPVPLTAEELSFFQENYFSSGYSVANQFLTSLYTAPEKIDLFELFYNGTSLPGAMSQEELDTLLGTFPEIWSDTDCTKLPVKDMDAILEQYTGLKLADTQMLGMNLPYLEQYDAYYDFHGDSNAMAVEFTGGFRQGDQVSLYYEDKMVTLVEAGDGWHIRSNQFAPMSTLPVQLPDAEPFLTVPVESFSTFAPEPVEVQPFTRLEWGQLVDDLFYQGTDGASNHRILVGVWPDGAIYACYVSYDNTAGEDTYYRFAKLCDADYAEDMLNDDYPGTLLIQPYTDFLGYSGFTLFCSYDQAGHRYYTFTSDGQLMQLLESGGTIDRQFTAGGRTFAFDDAGGLENSRLLIRDGDELRAASLVALLEQELPAPMELTLTQVDDRGVGVITYYDDSISYLPRREIRAACDGESLSFYPGEEQTYTDGIADHIDVPDAVLDRARWIAEQDLTYLLTQHPDMASLDDWRIPDIVLLEAKTVDGVPVELYAPGAVFHTADPEHFPYAGGTTITADGWLNMDAGYFEHFNMILRNAQTGECLVAPGDPYTNNTIDSLLADSPQLRAALTYTAELWGFREGDPAWLILEQEGNDPVVLENDWTALNVSHIFSILPQLEWTPCGPPKTSHTATVTLKTEQFDLVVQQGTRVVKKIEGDAISCLEAEQTGDAANAPYELLRSWFDELEVEQLYAQGIVIPDRSQTWQEAAQEFTDAYYGRRTETTSNSQFRWTFVTAEITAMDSEAAQMLKEDGYISKSSFPFFLQVIFVPETQRALENAIAGNYTGSDPKVPDGALEWNLCATVEKRDDGWHGTVLGTGW